MRILVCSDAHADAVTVGVPRFSEVQEAFNRVEARAVHGDVDLVLFLGDLCDPDVGVDVIRAGSLAIGVAYELARQGIASAWVAGNHDVAEDGRGTTTLDHLAVVSELVEVVKQPRTWTFRDVLFCFLPFVERAADYDPAAHVREFARRLPSRDDVPRAVIVAGHLNLEGIAPGSETDDMPRGRNVFFPIDEVRRLLPQALMLNGHYHRQQVYEGVHVPGSMARLRFDEEGHEPGYLVIDVEES